jgi:hypothetical protein
MRHAIDRISMSMSRDNVVDRAIDLCIALEMMLMAGSSQKAELTFRVALYGSLLLGGNSEDKKKNYELLRNVYKLRSSAVHSGRFDEKKEKNEKYLESVNNIIERGTDVTIDIACKIIKNREFVDIIDKYLFFDK